MLHKMYRSFKRIQFHIYPRVKHLALETLCPLTHGIYMSVFLCLMFRFKDVIWDSF